MKKQKRKQPPTKVIAPSGKCPYKLEGGDENSVKEWMAKIKKTLESHVHFLPSAWKYWVSHTYESGSVEWRTARESIDKLFEKNN